MMIDTAESPQSTFVEDKGDSSDNKDLERGWIGELMKSWGDNSESDSHGSVQSEMSENSTQIIVRKKKGNRLGPMPHQGLQDHEQDGDGNKFVMEFEDRKRDDVLVQFDGKTFHRNKCYHIKDQKDQIYGIINFLDDGNSECNSAFCVEVIDFDCTRIECILKDVTGRKDSRPKNLGEYVQRAGSKTEIELSKLEEMEENIDIPDWMYIEMKSGEKQGGNFATTHFKFGFEDTSKTPKRNGDRKSDVRGIDFFAGAGLASTGFEESGFRIVAAVERDDKAIQSYAKVHNATKSDVSSDAWKSELKKESGRVAFHGTVKDFLDEYAKNRHLRKGIGSLDFAILCPPCQGFSKANVGKKGNADENNKESLRILTVADLIQPKVIVFENVNGMWEKGEDPKEGNIAKYLAPIIYGLMARGYNVQLGQLCSEDFGDAQARPRLILIASLSKIGKPIYPEPTHGRGVSLNPYVSVQDKLRPEEGKHIEQEIPINREDEPKPNQPAKTVMASKSAPHYSENRKFSTKENAILMGQDAEFVEKLSGNNKAKQRQIGNGVPKELVKAICRSLEQVLKFDWVGVDDGPSNPDNLKVEEQGGSNDNLKAEEQAESDASHGNSVTVSEEKDAVGIKNEQQSNKRRKYNDGDVVNLFDGDEDSAYDLTLDDENTPKVKDETNVKNESVGMKTEDDFSMTKQE